MSASFAAVNRNKRGIAVDLQHPEGQRVAFDLCAARRRGRSRTSCPAWPRASGSAMRPSAPANPAVVYASVTGFGQTGPLARQPGLQHDRPGHERASWP